MLFNWCEVGAMYTMNVIACLTALSVEILDPSKSCDQCRDSLHGMNTHELQNILHRSSHFHKIHSYIYV